jgi:hypothetical protein
MKPLRILLAIPVPLLAAFVVAAQTIPSSEGIINPAVAGIPTSISVSSNVASISNGELMILSGQITAGTPTSLLSPSGTITFTDTTNNEVLGTAIPTIQCAGATAFCFDGVINPNSTQFTDGPNDIVATYSGDSTYSASGPSVAISVNCTAGCSNAGGQYIYLSFGQMNPANGISAAGGSLSFVVSITPGGGFTGAVNVACSVTGSRGGDVNIPTCSFSPAQVNIATSNSASSTLLIYTTAPSTSAVEYQKKSRWGAAGGMVLATLFLLGFPARRSRRHTFLVALILCLVFSGISGCGGGGSSSVAGSGGGGGGGSGATGTTPDTYNVTFTAADAATGKVTAQDYANFNVP